MGGLNLSDLGIETAEPTHEPWQDPPAPAPGTASLREAARTAVGHVRLQDIVADLGVDQAAKCLREAVNQIWGRRPDLMPAHALLLTAEVTGEASVETLRVLLGLVLPERTAARILELTSRRAAAFLAANAAWQPRLADEGVGYAEMERRALLGEFDESGPLASRFDLSTMTFRA